MNYFLGLDLSLTGTGAVLINSDYKILEKKLISTKPDFEIEHRLLEIFNNISSITNFLNITKIGIEGLSYGSRGQKMFQLAGLHYYIRMRIYDHGLDYEIISPQALKKFVTGKGNVKKEVMILETFKKFNEEFYDNNLCDAYCLARYIGANYGNKK